MGEWQSAKEECSRKNKSIYKSNFLGGGHLFCKIRMPTMFRKFKLKIGAIIKIRIAAKSFAGLGQWSELSKRGVRTRGPPAKMPAPKENVSKLIREDVRDIIYVQWDPMKTAAMAGYSWILGYQLKMAIDGTTKSFEEVYRGQSTSHIIYKPKKGTTYRFIVRARNIYDQGAYSEELVVRTGTQPGEMDEITSKRVDEEDIQFSWTKPISNGFSIQEYEVQIFDKRTYSFITEP